MKIGSKAQCSNSSSNLSRKSRKSLRDCSTDNRQQTTYDAQLGILHSWPVEDFKSGMRDRGFIESETVRYETRVAHGDAHKLPRFASELVQASVDLIVVIGAVTAHAAREATTDIPIVYAIVVDPVEDGLSTASRRAVGNTTGITTFDPEQALMHISLLRSVKADLSTIAILADRSVSSCLVQAHTRALREAELGSEVLSINGPVPDLEGAFSAMKRAGALVALEHPVNGANAKRIAELALLHGLPAVVASAQAREGALFGYGTSLRGAAYEMADYACRLLRGTTPHELPVTNFRCAELVINMRTARRLGLPVPPHILKRATSLLD
jgi:putative ABC transport system substrate-binding protein